MITFTNEILINRPIDEVYEYLVDFEHTPEWNWAITESAKVTPGPAAVGTRYKQARSVPRREIEELVITGLEPKRQVEVEGDPGRIRSRNRVRSWRRRSRVHVSSSSLQESGGEGDKTRSAENS